MRQAKISFMLITVVVAGLMFGCAAGSQRQSSMAAAPPSISGDQDHPVIIMKTNMGPIVLRLDARRAPATVWNFLEYVEAGFYSNTLFHRIIPGFMIQGGGIEAGSLRQKPTRPAVINESSNGYKNLRGTIAMARTRDLNSATSQFYINLVDNANLDQMRYTVFGEVTMGIETVDKIAAVPTRVMGAHENFPVQDIIIESVMVNK